MRIRADLHDRLAEFASQEGRHMRWVVERALESYMAQPSTQDRADNPA